MSSPRPVQDERRIRLLLRVRRELQCRAGGTIERESADTRGQQMAAEDTSTSLVRSIEVYSHAATLCTLPLARSVSIWATPRQI